MSKNLRLREERKRIGMNQTEFAEAGGVQISAQTNYERGVRNPDWDYLERISDLGVDVLYVVTGRRSRAVEAPVFSQQYGKVGNVVHAGDGVSIGDISIDMGGGKGRKK
ncbi:helix-turn-helix domain-containing protein [Thiothrix nivea]|uniref:Helix-turn-helix domain protein n=1 Tax=Thiothrix nivea (strain ATCC 35100 / DSM 5205 / JP2) TaxID=870187 RepID=A0A656H964_THINJ|nr:helix-turn-helix transcriptional regulator [Thiothrix nivea]EIJ33331.1 helix-turn-helix domain protein [Thiothrix nivea DSM 5205]